MNPFPLSHLRAIRLTGSDARQFIQSQVTADLRETESHEACPAAWCDAKGRVITTLLVLIRETSIDLVIPASLVEPVVSRLNMFRIGREVEVQPPEAVEGLMGCDLEACQQAGWSVLAFDRTRAIRLSGQTLGQAESMAERSDQSDYAWRQADDVCGWVWLTPNTSGQFLPQMLGLEALNGISYRKGCYPGQEIIARLHYRGRLTKRLMRYQYSTEQTPEPGTQIELSSGKATVLTGGRIEPTESGNADGCQGLAVVSGGIDHQASFDDQQGQIVFKET